MVFSSTPSNSHMEQMEENSTEKLKRNFEVLNYPELFGLENLWQIALKAESEQVSKLAIFTLCSLNYNISPVKKKHKLKTRENFIQTCTKNIKYAMETSENGVPIGFFFFFHQKNFF